VRAREGDLGIIPGTMGARSYIVRGKGNPESFMPPLVVTAIFPVAAPVGTSAVTSVSEITVKVADFPSNVTFVVCFRRVPVMVTEVPTGPLSGVNLQWSAAL